MSASAAHLARVLVEHARSAAVVDLTELSREPRDALAADESVEVRWVDAGSLPPGCSIAATYNRSMSPARISIAQDASAGRRRFSVLHEYAHHLRYQVPEVLTSLFEARGRSSAIEEKMSDAFASFVLIPEEVRLQAFEDGVTAKSVVELIAASSASEEAVAVAAAEAMSEPGYVLLLNPAGQAVFAARSGDVYPVVRGTAQSGDLLRAATGGNVRCLATIEQGGGVRTGELHIDSAPARSHVVVVAVDGRPAWSPGFSLGRNHYSAPPDGWCVDCSKEFSNYQTCRFCHEPVCPDCGDCGCESRPVQGERTCEGCWTEQPPAAYSSPTATRCLACE